MSTSRSQLLSGSIWWLLLVVCIWLYAPGLHGPFLLDDGANLRHLASLDDSAGYLTDVVTGNISGPFGRPVSMLSFAVSYAVHGSDPFVFKLHNLALHVVTGCAVLWFSYLVARRRGMSSPEAFACLSAALWLFSPLFVSTVLYAVQRMTQLSAFFVLGALIAYCKGREAWGRSRLAGALSLMLAVCLAAAAVLSKENGLLIVPLVILTELGVYRQGADPLFGPLRTRLLLLCCLVGAAAVLAMLLGVYGAAIFDYSRRDFSMGERLLTQARVLWDYAFGFLVPLDRGYGLVHDDVVVSRSLFAPASTLPALAGLVLLAGWSVWQILAQRGSLVAFGILFFLAGHLVESTVFPLELHFEHRNYLPAAGLSIAFVHLLMAAGHRIAVLRIPLGLVLALTVLTAAANLGVLSASWSNGHLLAIRNLEQHPESARANAEMAVVLASSGNPAAAVPFSDAAVALGRLPQPTAELRRLGLYCIARQPAPPSLLAELPKDLGQIQHEAANEALQMVANLVVDGQCDDASARRLADAVYAALVAGSYLTPTVAASMAKVENALGRYDRAMAYAEFLIGRNPDDSTASLMAVYFSWLLDDEQKLRDALGRLGRLRCAGKLGDEETDVYLQFAEAAEERLPAFESVRSCR